MLNDQDACSSSSSATIEMSASEISYDLKTMKQKNQRLSAAERSELKKKLVEEENQIRKEKATKSMNYLLRHSQKYSSLFLDKLTKNNNNIGITSLQNKSQKENINFHDESKRNQNTNSEVSTPIQQSKYFVGNLYPYQLEGLAWLKLLFENSVNGILADEMGLGKTIQVIALICSLIENKIGGPFLIVAPLSTLPNWVSEFKKFAPKIPVVLFHGSANERPNIYPKINHIYSVDKFQTRPVVLTSFQTPLSEGRFLRNYRWQYLIIDEGHRIKNNECQLYYELKKLNSLNRLLLTGTPLQNNLTELWTLLNFLMPQIFQNMNTFGDLFQLEDFNESIKILKQEEDTHIISTIHGVLNPFMLRRLKVDVLSIVPKKEVLVYCPLSKLQSDLYRYVLQKNVAKLTGKDDEEKENSEPERKKRKCVKKTSYLFPEEEDDFTQESPDVVTNDLSVKIPSVDVKQIHRQISLNSPAMIMRKIINHPFTVHCPIVPGTREIVISEDIVTESGKMMVLDAMLSKLKKQGHKVLIFSQFTSVLDFIEDYVNIRKYEYCRLDGNTDFATRQTDINEFNTNPKKFVFLLSTRAGGLGLNLTAADTVIFFDRDWNPQNDLQAQDRCHRIGQKKPVVIYTLISKGTIDDYILRRATAKRRLEKIVIQKDKFKNIHNPDNIIKSVNDLKELEELLNSIDHKQVIQPNGFVLSDSELRKLLDRSDLYKEMEMQNDLKPKKSNKK